MMEQNVAMERYEHLDRGFLRRSQFDLIFFNYILTKNAFIFVPNGPECSKLNVLAPKDSGPISYFTFFFHTI